ncbi:MAG TPA: M48 family metallopeptidase [Rhizomicrobium sp.]|nr:M48 family metallopeptidase [Rhizomicrobium sp.]
MTRISSLVALIGLTLLFWTGPVEAQQTGPSAAPLTTVQSHALAPIGSAAAFDPVKATNAYLARVSGKERTRSDSYFEGKYWLLLVDALWAIAASAALLFTRVSAQIRDFAERQTRSRFWSVTLYVGPFFLVMTALTFPLTLYEDYLREKAYGLMNQTFLGWFGEFLTLTGVNLIVSLVALTILYWVIRLAKGNWWIWGTIVFAVFATILTIAEPVLIDPLTNTYTPLPQSQIKDDILSLARANGIPAKNVYLVDASKQSDRISANVGGFLGTTRVALNDNLLHKGTHDEILAVLGHEMGHYVLDHAVFGLALQTLLAFFVLALVSAGFELAVSLFGGNWDVRRIEDPAGLPVLYAVLTIVLLLATPISNTITRTVEIQADMFGINAVRKPDAFSTVVLKLSNYRKLDPAPWEEMVFYDHPSGRTRIWEMMRWKAEHLNDPDIKAGATSPQ